VLKNSPPLRLTDTELAALAGECDIEFTRAGGPGGQHRNKVETAVRIKHRPSGVIVVASTHRSQARNKHLGLQRLAEKLATMERQQRLERQRRNRPKRRPTKAQQRRRVEHKRQRGETKRTRSRPRVPSDD